MSQSKFIQSDVSNQVKNNFILCFLEIHKKIRILNFFYFFNKDKAAVPEIYLKALMTAVTPFMLALFILIFWWIIKTVKHRPVIDDLATSLLIALNILQPTVINSMSQLISCREIDKGKYYIRMSLDYECYTSEHNQFVRINNEIV